LRVQADSPTLPEAATANVIRADRSQSLLDRHRALLILLAILLFAAIFRFTGLNFDSGTNQHPDERFIVGRTLTMGWPQSWDEFTNASRSPLNLRNNENKNDYIYGSLPVYMARGAAWLIDTLVPSTNGYFLRDYAGITQVGRHLAALFDLVTVLLVFLIGRRLFGTTAGLIASALVAFAVTHIQLAHFYASDAFLVTFMMAALYFSVRLMQRPSLLNALGAGIFVGLAIASKVAIAPFALIVVAAVVLRAFYRKRTRALGSEFDTPVGLRPASAAERARPLWRHLLGGLGYATLAGVASVLAFVVTEPYVLWQFNWSLLGQSGLEAFMNSNPWWSRLMNESQIQAGRADVPYTRQYVGTVPLYYHLQQMVLWGLSPIPGLVTVIGFLVGLWRAIMRKPAEILLMSGAIPYFGTILTLEAKWMRYMLPLVPIFCLLGAAMLVRGMTWQRSRWPARLNPRRRGFRFLTLQRNAFAAVTGITVAAAFIWAVAFMNIYSERHSRIQASEWIHSNVPEGARTSSEEWDDRLPLGVPGVPNRSFSHVPYKLYDDRPPDEAFRYINQQLAQTDYVILASNRLYDSVDNLPWRYPVLNRYYDLLFEEKLGFIRVHTSHVTPEIFGIRFDDQGADESFTVYDHPRVDVFKKVTQLTEPQMRSLFSPALSLPPGSFSQARHDETTVDKTLLYEQPLEAQPDLGDYAWNPLAQEDTQWIGVILWLLAIQLIGFLALPVVFTICRNLPDRGYAFAKLAGLLLVTYGVWMLASARLVPFTFWSILLFIGVLAALSSLCWRLGARQSIRQFFAERRSLIFFYEIIFFVAFGIFLFIRMLNPDLWHPYNGGEKPMEFGFLNATLRSPWMPPADPFFSDGYINYYYHGLFLIGTLIKLVGVDPAVAFNYAIPLLYALTFVAAASVVYNVVAWSQARRGSRSLVSRAGMSFGVLGGVLMLVIGNLAGFWQAVQIGLPEFGRNITAFIQNIGFGSVTTLRNFTPQELRDGANFDFWGPSRVIPNTINEFPFWSFLFADLHPHLINMPFTIFALGLGINLAFVKVRSTIAAPVGTSGWLSGWWHDIRHALAWLWGPGWIGGLTFLFTALALGLLLVTNSWDFPTYLGLLAGAVLIAVLRFRTGALAANEEVPADPSAHPLRPGQGWTFYGTIAAAVAALAGLAVAAYLPFFLHFKAFFTQILPLVDGGRLPSGELMRRTSLAEFIVIWFIFVAVAGAFLVARLVAYPWGNIGREIGLLFGGDRKRTQSQPPQPSPMQAFRTRVAGDRTSPARPLILAMDGGTAAGTGGQFQFRLGGSVAEDERGSSHASNSGQSIDHVESPPNFDGDASETGSSFAGGTNVEERVSAHDAPKGWLTGHVPENGHGNGTPDNETLIRMPGTSPATISSPIYPLPEFGEVSEAPIVAPQEAASGVQVEVAERPGQVGLIPAWLGALLLVGTAGISLLMFVTAQPLLSVLVLLLGGIAATTLGGAKSAAAHVTGLMFVGALAVALGVELVYLADHLQGGNTYRMNTIFKFYIQVWVLFALACAAAMYFLLFGVRDRLFASRAQRDAAPQSEETKSAHDTSPLNGDVGLVEPAETASNWLTWTGPLVAHEPDANGDGHTDLARTAENSDTAVDASTAIVDEKPRVGPIWSAPRVAWLGIFLLLFLASLAYPIFGTPARIRDRFSPAPPFGTLNGLKFMTTSTFNTDAAPLPINMKYDYDAIRWLNRNVSGLHTIAERVMGYYREYGMRVASNTGLPMVVGGLHQGEQRYESMVGDRHRDMEEFYKTTDVQTALNLINKYDIRYVYVGQLEQGMRDETGPTFQGAKFEQMSSPEVGILKRVFFADAPEGLPDTSIYEVVKPANVIAGAPVADSGIPGISITPIPTLTPTPMPTPPVDDPELKALAEAVAADPVDRSKREALINWYLTRGYPGEAAREFETLARQNPNDIAIRHQLGDAHQVAGNLDAALKAWEEARDVDPNNPAGHNKVGIAYLERGRYDDAIREFRAAVDSDRNFLEGWFHLGRAYEAAGNRDEARRAYETVVQSGGTEPSTWVEESRKRLNELR
jgi:YYY domain-containing protein